MNPPFFFVLYQHAVDDVGREEVVRVLRSPASQETHHMQERVLRALQLKAWNETPHMAVFLELMRTAIGSTAQCEGVMSLLKLLRGERRYSAKTDLISFSLTLMKGPTESECLKNGVFEKAYDVFLESTVKGTKRRSRRQQTLSDQIEADLLERPASAEPAAIEEEYEAAPADCDWELGEILKKARDAASKQSPEDRERAKEIKVGWYEEAEDEVEIASVGEKSAGSTAKATEAWGLPSSAAKVGASHTYVLATEKKANLIAEKAAAAETIKPGPLKATPSVAKATVAKAAPTPKPTTWFHTDLKSSTAIANIVGGIVDPFLAKLPDDLPDRVAFRKGFPNWYANNLWMYMIPKKAGEKRKNDWLLKADKMLKYLKSAGEKEMMQWLLECANERTEGKEAKGFVLPAGYKKKG